MKCPFCLSEDCCGLVCPAAPGGGYVTLTNQRMWDLVRHQRSELLQEGLITEDEYAELAQDHAAVKRLEDYDELAAKLKLHTMQTKL